MPGRPKTAGVGLGLIYHERPATVVKFLECPKFIHLLFIGVDLNCKIAEAADFILGWTTLDIGSDDVYGKPPEASPTSGT